MMAAIQATTQRTALLIRCSPEDAARIRDAAARERRTVSGYVLHILDLALRVEERLCAKLVPIDQFNRFLPQFETALFSLGRIRMEPSEAEVIAEQIEQLQLSWNAGAPAPAAEAKSKG